MTISGVGAPNVTSSCMGPLRVHLPKVGRERQISNSPAIKIGGGLALSPCISLFTLFLPPPRLGLGTGWRELATTVSKSSNP